MPRDHYGFTPAELTVFRQLTTPAKIQRFLDCQIGYNLEPNGATCLSPRGVLREGIAHCMEGALFGAAALRMIGFPPLLLDLEAVRDTDHVISLFRMRGLWGAVAKSNYAGLRFREPVYRSLRELVMSYFENYFNPEREKTLRAYSRPVNLRQFDSIGWMAADEEVWAIPEYLCTLSHMQLLPVGVARRLNPMDDRLYAANCVGRAEQFQDGPAPDPSRASRI
jgi:hypothetical protein